MTPSSDNFVTCEDTNFPGPGRRRILLNLTQRTVTFENCHWPRGFFSNGYESVRVCQFEELAAARDFLGGEHRGGFVRTVLTLGHAIGSPTKSDELTSMFISTDYGRCRVFADWSGFDEFRQHTLRICEQSPGGHWSDDPRLIPLYVLLILAVVGGITWLLI